MGEGGGRWRGAARPLFLRRHLCPSLQFRCVNRHAPSSMQTRIPTYLLTRYGEYRSVGVAGVLKSRRAPRSLL